MDNEDKIKVIKSWLGNGSINVFGLPFAGKDTHCTYLAKIFDAAILGGGDILRNSVIPDRVKDIMYRGELIPTDDFLSIVTPYLSSEEFQNKPLILSSVGRWHGEEKGVIGATEHSNHPIKAVVYLHITIKTAYDRFLASQQKHSRQRKDDSEEVLITRFSEFEEKTLPVIDYYRGNNLLIDIDGKPPVDEVRKAIVDSLYELAKNSLQ